MFLRYKAKINVFSLNFEVPSIKMIDSIKKRKIKLKIKETQILLKINKVNNILC